MRVLLLPLGLAPLDDLPLLGDERVDVLVPGEGHPVVRRGGVGPEQAGDVVHGARIRIGSAGDKVFITDIRVLKEEQTKDK